MTRIEALRALEECETQPKSPAEKMEEKEEMKGEREKARARARENERCFTVQARRRERGFLGLAVKETARDVIVPLRSPTWSTNVTVQSWIWKCIRGRLRYLVGIVPRNESLRGSVICESGLRVEDTIHDVAARVETVSPLGSDSFIVETAAV